MTKLSGQKSQNSYCTVKFFLVSKKLSNDMRINKLKLICLWLGLNEKLKDKRWQWGTNSNIWDKNYCFDTFYVFKNELFEILSYSHFWYLLLQFQIFWVFSKLLVCHLWLTEVHFCAKWSKITCKDIIFTTINYKVLYFTQL